jgi:hypothetical protein
VATVRVCEVRVVRAEAWGEAWALLGVLWCVAV